MIATTRNPADAVARSPDAGPVLRRVLWACDFSRTSEQALRYVLPLARAFGSEVTALHVIPADRAGEGEGRTPPTLAEARRRHDASERLDASVAPARRASLTARIALREGEPADEIVAFAASSSVDLLVLGQRRPRIPGEQAADVVGQVLARARRPLLVVPATPAGEDPALKTVLCATLSDSSAALDHAVAIARKMRARLVLLNVVAGSVISTHSAVSEARRRLRRVHERCTQAGCEVVSMVTVGSTAGEIVRVARDLGAGLVVIGGRDAHALHRVLFGSTRDRVVRESPCAMLSVPQR